MMFNQPARRLDSDGLAAELHGARLLAADGTMGEPQRPVVRHAGRLPRPQAGRHDGSLLARHVHSVPHRKSRQATMADFAKLTIRGDQLGHDVRSLEITEPGWWTLGMSFSADGQVHYYAHKGVADLTADDHFMSSFPYGEQLHDCSTTSSSTWPIWTTAHVVDPWVIDDPKVYVDSAGGPAGGPAVPHAPQPQKRPQNREPLAQPDRQRAQLAAAARERRSSNPHANLQRLAASHATARVYCMRAMADARWEFWIDVGGTFTDCLARAPDGTLRRHKLLS